ncbi:hypothetical protein E4T39_02290 [Aureobasidium subglaciale]|nr:hypothetical protein E4T39_02290 [Aureobasidium subglaciale]
MQPSPRGIRPPTSPTTHAHNEPDKTTKKKLYRAQTLISTQIQRLRTAMQDYDNDRWRFISSKVGSGFSATACKAKAEEIEAEDMREEDGAASDSDDDQQNTIDGDDIEEEDADGEDET